MAKNYKVRVGTRLADLQNPARIVIVRRVGANQVAAEIPGKDHLGRIWINVDNINTGAGAVCSGWRITP